MCVSGWGTGRKAKHEIGRRRRRFEVETCTMGRGKLALPVRIALLFIIQEVERDSDHGPPSALFILLLSDKMNCKVGFQNYFLRV